MAFLKRAALVFVCALLIPFALNAQSGDIRCSIKASPASVAAGQSTQLIWSSFGAQSASIESIGSVPTSGSRTVTPVSSRTYKLTVKGTGGTQFSCETSVTVTALQRPSCFISAWPAVISAGQSSTVSWGSSGAASLFISGLGTVPPSGTRTVRPDRTTTYAFTATSASGAVCTQTTHVTLQQQSSPYGYLPSVVQSFVAPLFGSNAGKANNNTSVYEDTWYFDDDFYDETYDAWDDYTYDDGSEEVYDEWTDDGYGNYTEDETYYDSYSDEADEMYDETYYESYYTSHDNEYYYEEDDSNDCWWDWWCGDTNETSSNYYPQNVSEEVTDYYYENYYQSYYESYYEYYEETW